MLVGVEEAWEWPLVLMMGKTYWSEMDLAAEAVRFEADESQTGKVGTPELSIWDQGKGKI
jgi:hypothetical protein